MANVRIKDLPAGPAPSLTDVVAVDGAQTRPNSFAQIRDLLAPFYASASQGTLASTALQPGYQPAWTSITGKPSFFSGSYDDLSNKPMLGALAPKNTVVVGDITASGAASSATFLRGDGSWSTPAGGGDMAKSVYDPTNINASAFDRANHNGTQTASTISNFSTAADARISAAIGVTVQAYAANLTTWAGVTPASGITAFLATPSSANLRAALTDEVGTGAAYFVGGALGTPASATLTNGTGLPIIAGTTGTLTVARGGTGLATLTANSLIVGAGTGNVTFIAPGANGTVLSSNGTTASFTSPPPASTSYGDVGTYVLAVRGTGGAALAPGATIAGSSLSPVSSGANPATDGSTLSGTWRCMGYIGTNNQQQTLFVRTV